MTREDAEDAAYEAAISIIMSSVDDDLSEHFAGSFDDKDEEKIRDTIKLKIIGDLKAKKRSAEARAEKARVQ